MKDFWDERFGAEEYAYGTQANAFLVSQKHLLKPGMHVLAVADGEGRNGVWLAEQGMRVDSVDYSIKGLEKSAALAEARSVTVNTILADLTIWDWPRDEYDLVIAIFIHFPPEHRAAMHKAMMAALKPGGLLILEAYHKDQLKFGTGGPPVEEMLYTMEQLEQDFADYECLKLEHVQTHIHEGQYHHGESSVLRAVFRRR